MFYLAVLSCGPRSEGRPLRDRDSQSTDWFEGRGTVPGQNGEGAPFAHGENPWGTWCEAHAIQAQSPGSVCTLLGPRIRHTVGPLLMSLSKRTHNPSHRMWGTWPEEGSSTQELMQGWGTLAPAPGPREAARHGQKTGFRAPLSLAHSVSGRNWSSAPVKDAGEGPQAGNSAF